MIFSLVSFSCFAMPGFHEPWGKDADLSIAKNEEAPPPYKPPSFLVRGFEKVYEFHQNVISPVDGPRSHFRPTSSRYMLLAMRKYGFFKGYIMGCDRLLRENSEDWVYRRKVIDGKIYKWDPPR